MSGDGTRFRVGSRGRQRADANPDLALEEGAFICEMEIHRLSRKQRGDQEKLILHPLDREDADVLIKYITTLAAVAGAVADAKERRHGRLDGLSDEQMFELAVAKAKELGERVGKTVTVGEA